MQKKSIEENFMKDIWGKCRQERRKQKQRYVEENADKAEHNEEW